jgi:hypothetical protein
LQYLDDKKAFGGIRGYFLEVDGGLVKERLMSP